MSHRRHCFCNGDRCSVSLLFFPSKMSCVIHHGREAFDWRAVGLGWWINFMSASKQPVNSSHLRPPQPAEKKRLTLDRKVVDSASCCWAIQTPVAPCSKLTGSTLGVRALPFRKFRLTSELLFSTKAKLKDEALLWTHTALSIPIYYVLSLAWLHTARKVLLLHSEDCYDRETPLTSTSPLSFH